jgi:hypothetical protein
VLDGGGVDIGSSTTVKLGDLTAHLPVALLVKED